MRKKLMNTIAHLATRHSWWVVSVALMVTVVCGVLAQTKIVMNANQDDLVSEKLPYHQRYKNFLKEFGDQEYLYAVVEIPDGDVARAKEFAEALGLRLQQQGGLREVTWKISNPAMERSFLLYLSTADVQRLRDMFSSDFSPAEINAWNDITPLFATIESRVSGPVSSKDEQQLATAFTFVDRLLDDMLVTAQADKPYTSRLQQLFFNGDSFDPDGFLRNGDLLFVLIMPQKDYGTLEVIAQPLADIRAAIDQTKKEFPGIRAGLTGRPVLAADELATTDRDMTRATIVALIALALLFALLFRGVIHPLLAMVSLVMGISWTFGVVAVAVGQLNVLTIVFAIILVGAAIEYAIHFVARYQEGLSQGRDVPRAISDALHTAGIANITSACTTSAAFLTIMWTDFTALAQLGMIAAIGILLCLISMIVVLPAMIMLCDRRKSFAQLRAMRTLHFSWLPKVYQHSRWLVAGTVLLTLMMLPFALRVSFDNNLLNLQAAGLESVEYEHLIIEKSSETTWFANVVVKTPEESRTLAQTLRALPSVRRVDDVSVIVPEEQEQKIGIVREMASRFSSSVASPPSMQVPRTEMLASLDRLAKAVSQLTQKAFSSGRVDAVAELSKFGEKLRATHHTLAHADDTAWERLGKFQYALLNDLRSQMALLATGLDPQPIALSDVPMSLAQRFVSPKGTYALYIYPKEDIWDPVALQRFVDEVSAHAPNVLGTPIEVHESARLMRETFARAGIAAFVVILVLVWLDFRSMRAALVAVLPLVLGMLWMVGFMALGKIPFNMANFFAIPILIGVGIDSGVHLVHRLRHSRSLEGMGGATAAGVVLTVLCNTIGFGMMMIASHRGIASLGQIMAIGCLCCLVAAFAALPPAAHRWLQPKNPVL